MARRGDVPTRHEVSEKVDHSRDDLQEKAEDVGEVVEDIETVRDTLESLDFGGTTEGADELEQAMDSAEDVTVDVFDREDEQVEGLQHDNEEHESDLKERSDDVDSDREKIEKASNGIETQETTNELVKAKESAIRDIEFLADQAKRALESREESERVQKEHQARAHSGRSH